jgi:hypothetical protein
LFFDVGVGFVEGIAVKVILMMTDLPKQPILMQVCRDDLFQAHSKRQIPSFNRYENMRY